MRWPLTTASALERNSKCAFSAIAPRDLSVNAGIDKGNAVHLFLQAVGQGKRDPSVVRAALAQVPEEYYELCASIPLERLPLTGNVQQEIPFCFNYRTGQAHVIEGMSGQRAYPAVPHTIVGTADVVGISEDKQTVLIADYKTGRTKVAAARRNQQLRFLAMAACGAFQCAKATVAILKILEDGSVAWDTANLDEIDLEMIRLEMVETAQRIEREWELSDAGRQPDPIAGEHCKWCPSKNYCPAFMGLARRIVSSSADVVGSVVGKLSTLTASEAYKAWRVIKEVERAIASEVISYAEEHPIELGDGRMFGPVLKAGNETLDGRTVFELLSQKAGLDVAKEVVEFSVTKTAIKRVMAPMVKAQGQSWAAFERELMEEVRAVGGAARKMKRSVQEYESEKAIKEASPALPRGRGAGSDEAA